MLVHLLDANDMFFAYKYRVFGLNNHRKQLFYMFFEKNLTNNLVDRKIIVPLQSTNKMKNKKLWKIKEGPL